MSKDRWDVYTWVGHGNVVIRESNVPFKDAQKAKEKWIQKSPKHEAFIALHGDKRFLKDVLKEPAKPKAKAKTKAKDKAKVKDKSKDKSKAKAKKK